MEGETTLAWLSQQEQDIWRVMVAVHTRLVARMDAELISRHGISLRDYEVLVQLSEADEAKLRMAELAERLFVSPSGLTRRLDGLVRSGYVKRQVCLSDRRGMLAVLSTSGWEIMRQAAPTHLASVRRYVFDPLEGRQLYQLSETLRAMSGALEPDTRPRAANNQGSAG